MAFLATILVSGIGTAIATYFTNKSWDHQERVKMKETELQVANDIFTSLSSEMDTRLYSMRQVFWGIESGSVPEEEMAERWKNYQKILFQWNSTLNKKLSMTERYFGKKMSDILEFEIQENFRALHGLLNEYYQKVDQRKKFDKAKFNKIADDLSELNRKFNVEMIQSIQNGLVGIFHPDVK